MNVLSASKAGLGECAVWDDRSQRLFWIDIEAGKIFAATLQGEETVWTLPERIGSFGLTTATHVLVIALESGFALYDLESRRLERIPMPQSIGALVRFNDGKCGPDGSFWAGTMSEKTPRQPDGRLYRLRPDRSVDIMRGEVVIANGLSWSADGARMYFADSPTKSVVSYAFQSGMTTLGAARPFIGAEVFRGVPDGSTVDAADRYWSAEWDGWRLLVFENTGRLAKEVPLPVGRPTSCCFGGPDLDTLFITTASVDDLPGEDRRQPNAGRVLVIENAGKGTPSSRFRLL